MDKMTKKSSTFEEVKGDALTLFFESEGSAALMHGANCQKVMGAGIANQIRQKLSPLFYLDQYDARTPSQRFGSYSAVVVAADEDNIKIGVNLYTQLNPGRNFCKIAFANSLKSFSYSIPVERRKDMTIYMPKIGCGIGGAKWEDVEPIVKEELADFNVVAVSYKKEEVVKEPKKD